MSKGNKHPTKPVLGIFSEPGKAGVKRHVVDILNGIDLDKLSVFFVYSLNRKDASYESQIEVLRSRGIRCYELNLSRRIAPVQDLIATFKYMRIVLREKPTVVHLHASKAGFIGRLSTKFIRPRTVTIFTPNVLSILFGKKYWPLEWLASFFTDWIVGSCKSESFDLEKTKLFKKEKILTLPLCVNTKNNQSSPPPKKEPPSKITVASCGRISYQKNALLFFKTAKLLQSEAPEVLFLWIGDFDRDEEANEVERFLAKYPLTNTTITGWVNNADDYIRQCDIFLMLSRYESFGYVNADAQLKGKPVIATDVTGNRDLIQDSHNGFIVEENENTIAEKIKYLAQNSEARIEMGNNANRFIKRNYDLSKMHRCLHSFYDAILNGHNANTIQFDDRQ